jgi:hypothetical protein
VTICTVTAPDEVRTFRTNREPPTDATDEDVLGNPSSPPRTRNPQVTGLSTNRSVPSGTSQELGVFYSV